MHGGDHMKVSELKARKIELGYTNEMVSKLSGVPLGTVQKIFGGATAAPRYETLKQIERALFPGAGQSREDELYGASSGSIRYEDIVNSSSVTEPLSVRETSALEYYGYNNFAYAGKKQGDYTVDDLLALPEGLSVELIDGCLYDMAPPTTVHQYLIGQVFRQIDNILVEQGNKHCMPIIAPAGVQLFRDKRNLLLPDLMVVCDKSNFRKGVVYGAPDLVMEVLSPSTGGYDRLLKLNKYWEGGVREYWIIDPKHEQVIVYCFDRGVPPATYSFTDMIPIGISETEGSSSEGIYIDFRFITERMHDFFGNEWNM